MARINGRIHPSRMTGGRHQRPPARVLATWCSSRGQGGYGFQLPAPAPVNRLPSPRAGLQPSCDLPPSSHPTWSRGHRSHPSQRFQSLDEGVCFCFNEPRRSLSLPHRGHSLWPCCRLCVVLASCVVFQRHNPNLVHSKSSFFPPHCSEYVTLFCS